MRKKEVIKMRLEIKRVDLKIADMIRFKTNDKIKIAKSFLIGNLVLIHLDSGPKLINIKKTITKGTITVL